MTSNLDATAVDAAAELGYRRALGGNLLPYVESERTSLIVRAARDDERLDVVDLEYKLDAPRRQRGSATLVDPADFVAYVQRLATDRTIVYADEQRHSFTAIFNDHGTDGGAGWRDHRAQLMLKHDPDWLAWSARDSTLGMQTEFAEHLEDSTHTLVEPDAATMLEVATTFQAHRQASFSRGTRLASGDVQLAWSEETSASAGSGRIEIPERFTLALAPYRGSTAREVIARLRYRLKDGTLHIGYRLHRPDVVLADAFADIRDTVDHALDVPVLLGVPPIAVERCE